MTMKTQMADLHLKESLVLSTCRLVDYNLYVPLSIRNSSHRYSVIFFNWRNNTISLFPSASIRYASATRMGRSIGRWFGGQEISLQLYINIIAAESDRVCKEETRTGRKVSKAKQGDVLLSL